jgi:hypothetical protein
MNCGVGNSYSITNVSQTRTAKVFFAQGCEVKVDSGLSA